MDFLHGDFQKNSPALSSTYHEHQHKTEACSYHDGKGPEVDFVVNVGYAVVNVDEDVGIFVVVFGAKGDAVVVSHKY